MRAVPGHDAYVLCPYVKDYPRSAELCRKMGGRCGVTVNVEFEENTRAQEFWKLFKEREGAIPGQKDKWRGKSQWTAPLNTAGDRVVIYVGHAELLWLYIRAGERQASQERAARMRRYSWLIYDQLADQQLGENLEKHSSDGMTITVQRAWTRDDEDEWPEVAGWIKEQFERLRAIVADPPGEENETIGQSGDRAPPSGA